MHDVQTRFKSYSARDQLDVSGRAKQFLEWDRDYVTVLGVANRRLYEFRLQSSHRNFEAAKVCADHNMYVSLQPEPAPSRY